MYSCAYSNKNNLIKKKKKKEQEKVFCQLCQSFRILPGLAFRWPVI